MTQTSSPNNGVILERIENVRSDIAELKAQLTNLTENQYRFEKTYVEKHAEVLTLAQSNKTRLDRLEPEVRDLMDSLRPLVFQSRIIAWMGAIFGASVITLIWAILTHQVAIGLP